MVSPRDEHRHGKFRAWYSWSRGPTRRMVARFRGMGFGVLEYHGYFGHDYYERRLPLLHHLEERKTRFLLKHPIALATAYAGVVLRKA